VLVLRQLLPGLRQLMLILRQLTLNLCQPRRHREPLIPGRKSFQLDLEVC
jgi:hypothetical protein